MSHPSLIHGKGNLPFSRLLCFMMVLCVTSKFENVLGWSTKVDNHCRRDMLKRTIAGAAVILVPQVAMAAPVPTTAELKKLQLGHARVQYLLQNWDAITTTCNTKIMSDSERKQVIRTEGGGGGVCDKSPLRVQEFIGYKSTEDPLYRAEKLMVRAAQLVDPDSLEDYLTVVEAYRDKADNSAMMAYTSSWGEANPNGGKETIDTYLVATQNDVMSTEKLLRQVLGFLNLEVLPVPKPGTY